MRNKVCLAFAALLGACSVHGSYPVPQQQSLDVRTQFSAPLAGGHLYVSDARARHILRFPMMGGIPALTPDATIAGFVLPRGIAIGPDGRLYVVDAHAKQLVIFPPKPDGNTKPVATFSLHGYEGLSALNVDPRGYIYVGYAHTCNAERFWCSFANVYAPFDQGMKKVISLFLGGGSGGYSTTVVMGMAVNSSKLLSVITNDHTPPAVYTGAPYPKSVKFMYCGGVYDSGTAWGPDNLLYATDRGGTPQQPAQVVVFTQIVNGCPAYYTITSSTIPLSFPWAVATNGKYIYVTSSTNSFHTGYVFVFDPNIAGAQTPVEVIQSKGFFSLKDPGGVAVGP